MPITLREVSSAPSRVDDDITEATYEANYEDVVEDQNDKVTRCAPLRKVEVCWEKMVDRNLPPWLYWTVTTSKYEKLQRRRAFSPMTERESRHYSDDHFSPQLPVRSHEDYRKYPPFYFEYRHKYRMQEKKIREQRGRAPRQQPIEVPIDAAFGPNYKKARYDDEVDVPIQPIEVPWADNSDARSTRSTQSWPTKKRESRSQEKRDLGFASVCQEDKPDARPERGSSAPQPGKNRWGNHKHRRSASESSNDKSVKSAKTSRTPSSVMTIDHKIDNDRSHAMLAEASRMLAEVKLKNEELNQKMEAKRRFEFKKDAFGEINEANGSPHHLEFIQAVKGVHFDAERGLVLIPATKGRLQRRPEYDPAREHPYEWLYCTNETDAILRKLRPYKLKNTVFGVVTLTEKVRGTAVAQLEILEIIGDNVVCMPEKAPMPPPPDISSNFFAAQVPPVMRDTPEKMAKALLKKAVDEPMPDAEPPRDHNGNPLWQEVAPPPPPYPKPEPQQEYREFKVTTDLPMRWDVSFESDEHQQPGQSAAGPEAGADLMEPDRTAPRGREPEVKPGNNAAPAPKQKLQRNKDEAVKVLQNYQLAADKVSAHRDALVKVAAPLGEYADWQDSQRRAELQAAAADKVQDISKTIADDLQASKKKAAKAKKKNPEVPLFTSESLAMVPVVGSRASVWQSAGRSQSTSVSGSGGSISEVTPSDTPATQSRTTLDSVQENYTVPAEAAPFMKDKHGMTDEQAWDDPKDDPNHFEYELEEQLDPQVNHSGHDTEMSFEGETKENPHQTAYENIAGSAGVAYGARDDRLRQSMAKNLKAAHETGKAFSICQVCNQPTPKYTVLMWCWVRSLKAVESCTSNATCAKEHLGTGAATHDRALDWQPNNRLKNIRNQAWNVVSGQQLQTGKEARIEAADTDQNLKECICVCAVCHGQLFKQWQTTCVEGLEVRTEIPSRWDLLDPAEILSRDQDAQRGIHGRVRSQEGRRKLCDPSQEYMPHATNKSRLEFCDKNMQDKMLRMLVKDTSRLTPGARAEVDDFRTNMPSASAVIAMTRKSDVFAESSDFLIQVAPGVCVCYCCTNCWIIPLLANMWYLVNARWDDAQQCTVAGSNKGQQWYCANCISRIHRSGSSIQDHFLLEGMLGRQLLLLLQCATVQSARHCKAQGCASGSVGQRTYCGGSHLRAVQAYDFRQVPLLGIRKHASRDRSATDEESVAHADEPAGTADDGQHP